MSDFLGFVHQFSVFLVFPHLCCVTSHDLTSVYLYPLTFPRQFVLFQYTCLVDEVRNKSMKNGNMGIFELTKSDGRSIRGRRINGGHML